MNKLLLLIFCGFTLQVNAKLLSTYTSLDEKSCVIYDSASLHRNPEIDYLTQECVGFGGYQVMISGGDLRYPLSLVYHEKEIELTRFESFHDVASSKVEWLYKRTDDGKIIYKALIHRISYYENEKNVQVLIVSKLDKENTCSVGVIKQSAHMNEEARVMAEKVDSMTCLDLNKM
jgi:hypothetical protein